jgi:hypothetical protein
VASCNGGSCQFACNPGFERNGNQCRSCVACPEGQKRCQGGNTVQECVRMGSCTEWRTAQTCSSARSCSRTGTSCECKEAGCTPGCASVNTERTCEMQDGCPAARERRCPDPKVCESDRCDCSEIVASLCRQSQGSCTSDGRVRVCTTVNGCRVLSNEACPAGQVCQPGNGCVPSQP